MIGVSLSDNEPIAYYLAKDEAACLLWAVNKAKAGESINKPGVMVSVDNVKLIRHFTPFDFHDVDHIDVARAVMYWFRMRAGFACVQRSRNQLAATVARPLGHVFSNQEIANR